MHTNFYIFIIVIIVILAGLATDNLTGDVIRYRFGPASKTCFEDGECGNGFCQKLRGEEDQGRCRPKYNQGTMCYKNVQCRSLCCNAVCSNTNICYPNYSRGQNYASKVVRS
ncbi:MAG: hypothetical protein HY363_01420 [Candidatus Aenigmarchaeota archaeon]|nr:hypothetical protein [Candidatus Aenigmarchaeota archaeon]